MITLGKDAVQKHPEELLLMRSRLSNCARLALVVGTESHNELSFLLAFTHLIVLSWVTSSLLFFDSAVDGCSIIIINRS